MCSVAVRPTRSMRRSRDPAGVHPAPTRAPGRPRPPSPAAGSSGACGPASRARAARAQASRLSSPPVTSSTRPAGACHDQAPARDHVAVVQRVRPLEVGQRVAELLAGERHGSRGARSAAATRATPPRRRCPAPGRAPARRRSSGRSRSGDRASAPRRAGARASPPASTPRSATGPAQRLDRPRPVPGRRARARDGRPAGTARSSAPRTAGSATVRGRGRWSPRPRRYEN